MFGILSREWGQGEHRIVTVRRKQVQYNPINTTATSIFMLEMEQTFIPSIQPGRSVTMNIILGRVMLNRFHCGVVYVCTALAREKPGG